MLTGYYDIYGYHIQDESGEIIYKAGNNPLESTSVVPQACGLPLKTIKNFCWSTCEEMARERGIKNFGIFPMECDK